MLSERRAFAGVPTIKSPALPAGLFAGPTGQFKLREHADAVTCDGSNTETNAAKLALSLAAWAERLAAEQVSVTGGSAPQHPHPRSAPPGCPQWPDIASRRRRGLIDSPARFRCVMLRPVADPWVR